MCELYLQAMGFRKDEVEWQWPADMDLPEVLGVVTEGGMVRATVLGDTLSGYRLVAWLIFRSKARGVHPVMIGALVMAGVHDVSVFAELEGFETSSTNLYLKTMQLTQKAANIQVASTKSSTARDHGDGRAIESLELTAEPRSQGVTVPSDAEATSEVAASPDIVLQLSDQRQGSRVVSKGLRETTGAYNIDTAGQAEDEHRAPKWSWTDDAPELQDSKDLAVIVKAFNGDMPSERKCLEKIKATNKIQFCTEILVGRLLLMKKEELKSTALLKKWKNDSFPEECDKHFFSRCLRYAQFDQFLKGRRGLPLEARDLKLFTKKAMLLIGGYKKKERC